MPPTQRRTEAVTPPEMIERLLRAAAGKDAVLVGGQALGWWVQRYNLVLPDEFAAISGDTDVLAPSPTSQDLVKHFARVMRGDAFFPSKRALGRTALVGQAYLDISEDEMINVDVVFKLVGVDPDAVRARAVPVEFDDGTVLRVMHPLDVLASRLANLYKLAEKQNAKGVMQLAMAIDAAREFVREQAAGRSAGELVSGRSPIQGYVSEIERLACLDAGRKVVVRYGVYVADAIDPSLIPAGPFWSKRWPGLKKLMSAEYANQFLPTSSARA